MDSMSKVTNRRDFMKTAAATGAALAALEALNSPLFANVAPATGKIPFMQLPYATNALAPSISEKTVQLHYTQHHKVYYDRLTGYINANPEFSKYTLEELIKTTRGSVLTEEAIFNFAVLLWNHDFYWKSMKPQGGILPENKSELTKLVITSFGSVEKFKEKFIQRCNELGIGWVWLVKTGQGIDIIRTHYLDNLIPSKIQPLLTIDVWEHAYYMDYGSDRTKYVENYLQNIVNWEFAEANYKSMGAQVIDIKAHGKETEKKKNDQ